MRDAWPLILAFVLVFIVALLVLYFAWAPYLDRNDDDEDMQEF